MPFLVAFDPVAILQSAVPFIAILVILVTIHEFGHFITAKMFNIKVLEFGIGFPPRIKGASIRRGETEYTINWLPIGGFVRLLGEEDPSDPRSLAAAAPWKRLVVMFAGVFMNLALALVLMGAGWMVPRDRALYQAQITQVAPGSPAATAEIRGQMRDGTEPLQGLQPGDIVKEVAGREIANTQELVYANRLNLGEWQDWTITRAGSTLTARVYARLHPPADQGPVGIRIGAPANCTDIDAEGNPINCQLVYDYTESVSYSNPVVALKKGFWSLYETMVLTKNELRVKLGGGGGGQPDGPAFQGPVGIAAVTGKAIDEAGWRSLIELSALLSLNLGLFNVLPLPMLDGGRMLFVVIEIVRGGKRIAPEKESLVHLTGFVLFMLAAIVMTFFDIQALVS